MEVYISPPEDAPGGGLQRAQVLAALSQAGLLVTLETEQPGAGIVSVYWELSFRGSDARLVFQERAGSLVFATLEHSMFDTSSAPERICGSLEGLGWEADQESVG